MSTLKATGLAKGVVTAGHRETAEAAASVLREGGNAFDAAIAGVFASCVNEVVLASPGGGGFLIARQAGADVQTCRLYDFFAQTPMHRKPDDAVDFREISADFGRVSQQFHIGAGASATPGILPGLTRVHDDLGRMNWADLLRPATRLARDGVRVTPYQAYLFGVVEPILTASPEARQIFSPNDALLQCGDVFSNPALGDFWAELGQDRVSGLTILNDAAIAQSTAIGGHLAPEDMTGYCVAERTPLRVSWAGQNVWLNAPPAAGGALVGLGLAHLTDDVCDASRFLAAMEVVNSERRRADGDVGHLASALGAMAQHPAAYRGTTHLGVIDSDGNAAGVTVSNGEGNGLILGDTGVMLNNMLGEEDVLPDGIGSWPTNVRLSSMMAPTIVAGVDGDVSVYGSGGSNRIRTALMQVIARATIGGADLADAIAAPRMHLEKDGHLSFEDFFSPAERVALLAAYPDATVWAERNMFFGGVHAVHRSADGIMSGAGDSRRDGVVVLVN